MNTNLLSKAAAEKIAELERQIKGVVSRDAVREPKLEPGDAARVAELEETIADLEPKIKALDAQLTRDDARFKALERVDYLQLLLDGVDLAALADEMDHLKRKTELAFEVLRSGMFTLAQAHGEVVKIKERARAREARDGR
jgi:hypothetical protein